MIISDLPPKASDYWNDMPSLYKTFNGLLFFMVLIIFILTVKMIHDVLVNARDDLVQSDMLWVLCTPLNVALCCAVGNCFPRSAELLISIGLIILMVSLYKVTSLVYNSFGGSLKFSWWLRERNRKISLNVPPCCCCCKCLPKPEPTVRNLHRLKWIVLQSPVIRILVQLALLIMTWEEIDPTSGAVQTMTYIGVISTLFGIFVTHILMTVGKEFLQEHGIMVMVRSADIAQGLFTGLKGIFDAISKNNDNFGDTDFMNAQASGNFFFNVAATFLFLILAIVQFIYIRPGKCKLFKLKILASD